MYISIKAFSDVLKFKLLVKLCDNDVDIAY